MHALAVPSAAILDSSDEVFVIGSCFANEIRAVLERMSVAVHPLLLPDLPHLFPDALKIAPAWGAWDERVSYQCYTPFSIRQEVATALGHFIMDEKAVFERTEDGKVVFWDPYRRAIYAYSPEVVLKLRNAMTAQIRTGLHRSALIIITLGLIEAHRLRKHDGYACEYNLAFSDQTEFVNAGATEAIAALTEAVEMIRERFPQKPIVLTVSPIPLSRTFTDNDVVTATTRGKSILRTACEQIIETFENIYYWPSYEYVMWKGDGFSEEDLRHIRKSTVQEITFAFCYAFFKTPSILDFVTRAASCDGEIQPAFIDARRKTKLTRGIGSYLRNPSLKFFKKKGGRSLTHDYFKKARHRLVDSLLAGKTPKLHGSASHDEYQNYGRRELEDYQNGTCVALVDGIIREIPSKEAREALHFARTL